MKRMICKIKPVALSLANPDAEYFVLKSRGIPTVSDLFDKKYLTFQNIELLKACTDISIDITERVKKLIEKDTQKVQASTTTEQGGLVHPSANLSVTQKSCSALTISCQDNIIPQPFQI